MTTHEYAQLLLSQPNVELYSEHFWDHDGCCDNPDERFYYQNVNGIDFNRVENGAVITVDDVDYSVNNKKYNVGDVFFVVDDLFNYCNDESELLRKKPLNEFKQEDLNLLSKFDIVRLLAGQTVFSYKFDSMSLEKDYRNPKLEIENSDFDTLIHDRFLIVMEGGFVPKTKEMTASEAYDWFNENHSELFDDV